MPTGSTVPSGVVGDEIERCRLGNRQIRVHRRADVRILLDERFKQRAAVVRLTRREDVGEVVAELRS
jgi:hypothetical protein